MASTMPISCRGDQFECLVPIKFVCKPNERSEEGTRDWPEIESIWFTKIPLKQRLDSDHHSGEESESPADEDGRQKIQSIQVSQAEPAKSLAEALKQVSARHQSVSTCC